MGHTRYHRHNVSRADELCVVGCAFVSAYARGERTRKTFFGRDA